MKVAILCPGPSIRFFRGGAYSQLIGVNRAVLLYRCDWWAVSDRQIIFQAFDDGIDYQPKIFTRSDNKKHMAASGRPVVREYFNQCHKKWYEDPDLKPRFQNVGEHKCNWPLFTATAAIVLAKRLGAKQIDIYGADMRGTRDFDGFEGEGYNRTEDRWDTERTILNRLTAWMADHGTTIRRVLGHD
jgi:hypothetical protein